MTADVVVLDYGSGNTRSAVRALERAGAHVTLTADRSAAMDCDGLVVPGVGAFKACVDGIRAVKGHEVIGRRLAGGRPVLGICVGMQVLFEHGVEHGVDTPGLDEWPGVVERLQAPVVPHMGWNCVAHSGPFSTAATNRSPPCDDHVTSGAFVRSFVRRVQSRTPYECTK